MSEAQLAQRDLATVTQPGALEAFLAAGVLAVVAALCGTAFAQMPTIWRSSDFYAHGSNVAPMRAG